MRGSPKTSAPSRSRGRRVLRVDVSRILFRPRPAATISLGSPLPTISSTLPAPVPRTAVRPAGADRRAACACTRWGLPCPVRHRPGGALLPHRFTLTPSARRGEREGGLFSVALSLAPQRAGGGYPPPCPVVFGLSSGKSPCPRSPVHVDILAFTHRPARRLLRLRGWRDEAGSPAPTPPLLPARSIRSLPDRCRTPPRGKDLDAIPKSPAAAR